VACLPEAGHLAPGRRPARTRQLPAMRRRPRRALRGSGRGTTPALGMHVMWTAWRRRCCSSR